MPRGGKRLGAGRPQGQGKYGEATMPLRIPVSMVDEVMAYRDGGGYACPLYSSHVSAGFPSPADEHMEGKLDLNQYLIKHPAATFFVRVTGDSMINAGIHPGDVLVVDRSLTPADGRVVIVALDGELTVKRLYKKPDRTMLLPENDAYEPIVIREGQELHIWGVVTSVVHHVT